MRMLRNAYLITITCTYWYSSHPAMFLIFGNTPAGYPAKHIQRIYQSTSVADSGADCAMQGRDVVD